MADILELPEVKLRLDQSCGPILLYLVPQSYLMQGMIADTGQQWRLYEHHETFAIIADWTIHPFRHLEGGDMMMHHNIGGASVASTASGGMVRRLVFLQHIQSLGPGTGWGSSQRPCSKLRSIESCSSVSSRIECLILHDASLTQIVIRWLLMAEQRSVEYGFNRT